MTKQAWTQLVVLAAVLGGSARAASAQDDTLRLTARPFVGCYAVHLGEWSRPLGRDAAYHTPPDTIVLDSVLIDGPLLGPGFRLAPHVETLARGRTVIPPRWWLLGADSVRLMWTSGYAGISFRLARTDRGLAGYAEAFSDVIPVDILPDGSRRRRPWPSAAADLRRIACQ